MFSSRNKSRKEDTRVACEFYTRSTVPQSWLFAVILIFCNAFSLLGVVAFNPDRDFLLPFLVLFNRKPLTPQNYLLYTNGDFEFRKLECPQKMVTLWRCNENENLSLPRTDSKRVENEKSEIPLQLAVFLCMRKDLWGLP